AVEEWIRLAPFGGSVTQIMQERVHAGDAHVGISLEIPRGVEQRIRIATFLRAVIEVVHRGVIAAGSDLRIGPAIPVTVNQARSDDRLLLQSASPTSPNSRQQLEGDRPPQQLCELPYKTGQTGKLCSGTSQPCRYPPADAGLDRIQLPRSISQ